MTPIKVEYVFAIKNHRMKAVAEHCDLSRKFSFYFDECKCQYKNAQKVENKNVHFPMLYSSACVSKKDRFSLSRYDGPFIETICE